jgi:multidrug efflux pump subunit AcrB
VDVNPAQLSALGLTLEDVRTALSDITVDDPKGILEGATQSYALQTNDQIAHVADYNNTIIAYRDGAPIRIRDVGHASIGAANNQLAAWYDETPAIVLAIQRTPDANVIQTVDLVTKELPRREASMPRGVKLSSVLDRTTTIRAAVSDVEFTLMLTIGLVVMSILVFLRNLWATIIPGVPTSGKSHPLSWFHYSSGQNLIDGKRYCAPALSLQHRANIGFRKIVALEQQGRTVCIAIAITYIQPSRVP